MNYLSEEFENSLCERLNLALKGKKLKTKIEDWCKFICKAHLNRIKLEFEFMCDKGDENPVVHLANINSYEIHAPVFKEYHTGLIMQTKDMILLDPLISTVEDPSGYPKNTVKDLIDTGIALPLLSATLGNKFWVTATCEMSQKDPVIGRVMSKDAQIIYRYKTIKLYVGFYPTGLSEETLAKINHAKNA